MRLTAQRFLQLSVVEARPVTRERAPWPPFVIAALCFTTLVGALTGALDLWTLRVLQKAVPEAHRTAHAIGQLFGFLWLLTLGVSLHLAPRFFAWRAPSKVMTRVLAWAGIGGALLLVIGRFGVLVPGSQVLGPLGALLVLAAMSTWGWWLSRAWRQGIAPKEPLHFFVTAGAAWWWLAALAMVVWSFSPARVPLEAVWRAALFGGVGSWLWGVFFRAGICTLRVARASLRAQRFLLIAWQLACVTAVASVFFDLLTALSGLALAFACGVVWWLVRPFSGQSVAALGALQPRAIQAGLVFLLAFGALQLWVAARALGTWSPALLDDASRHAFTLGAASLLAFGFAGRMVPGFAGVQLQWPRVYDAGVLALALGAGGRLCELSSLRVAQAIAGGSGPLAFFGVALCAAALLRSIRVGGQADARE
ncbi:MAG: hypothetical protein JNM17_38965 [Archangium sp.]|nr:hypothetical protein [Archangium sp.]